MDSLPSAGTPGGSKQQQLTEPDKRRLMSLFLQSEDILYFTYGLLYPQAIIQMQAQSDTKLISQFDEESK